MAGLRPVMETCEPRADVLAGGLTDAHFAAQLDQVVRNPSQYPVYGDPTEFFAITYPTKGLRDLLTSTFGRLSGRAGQVSGAEHGVVRFQTSFGGGKTHGLIAAYHLATGARPFMVGEFVDPELLPDDCLVAAVVGDTLDAVNGTEAGGRRVSTMWGAVGAQLGGDPWSLLERSEETRSAPGKDVWVELFETRPTLVIIDEVAAHLRALSSSGDEAVRRQAEAMPAFLFNLFSAAAQVPTARVVITLATATDAFGAETEQVERTLDRESRVGHETESVLSRYREVLVPAEDDEIAEILRRRLFASIDEAAAADAADAFVGFYDDLGRREVPVNPGADIGDQIRRSYPFHPELVRVLDTRVGTIPDFQRTRGALRLLAETVAALWSTKSDAKVINVADLPLDAEPVANAVTRAIGREPFAQVLAADVAGGSSHAGEIDRSRFAGVHPYATRAATTVFLHSLEQTAATGATLVDVWRGTLLPGDDPDLVEEALRLIDQSAWHFSYDGSRYRFQTEPNPRKIVEDEQQGVPNTTVREELDHRISVMYAPSGPIKTRVFPTGPADIEDKAELQVGVIHYDVLNVTVRSASPSPTPLVEMLDTYGVAGSNRTYRNGVVFLVGDGDHIEAMRSSVRYHLAARRIVDDGERMQAYTEEVRDKLQKIADKAGLDARVAITRCYRHLYYPKSDRANRHLRHHELSPTRQGEQEKNQTPVILHVLEGIGKIRTAPISTDFLAQVAGFPHTDPISTEHVVDGFWRNHDTDLILNPNIVMEALGAGIRNGSWVYYDADTEKAYTDESPPPAPRIAPSTFLYTRGRAEGDGLLRRDPTWDDLHRELTQAGGVLSGTELRSRLEKALRAEPTKKTIVDIVGRVIRQEEPPVVVVDGEPAAASKPLSPSAVERIALERLTLLTRTKAEELGVEVATPTAGFRLEQSGPAGQVFATLADKLAELGADKRIGHIDIQATVTAAGTGELRTLLSVDPMLPKMPFTVTLVGAATFPGLSGDVTVSGLTGPAGDFRKIDKQLFDLFDRADDTTIDAVLTHTPPEPLHPHGDAWQGVAKTVIDLNPGVITVRVRGR